MTLLSGEKKIDRDGMMKKLLLAVLISFVYLSGVVWAQDVYVMYVQGKVTNVKSGKLVNVGEKIDLKEKLIFGSKDAFVDVFDEKDGRFLIKPLQNMEPDPENETMYTLLNIVSNSNKNLGARAGYISNELELVKQFDNKKLLLLDDKYTIKIAASAFPMNEHSFFFLRYQYQGQTINKKLAYDGDTLVFTGKEIFTIDGKPIDGDNIDSCYLYYYESEPAAKPRSKRIANLSLKQVDNEILTRQAEILLNTIKEENKQNAVNDLLNEYFSDYYGSTTNENLSRWLKNHFAI